MARPQISKEERAALRGVVASHMHAHKTQQREFRDLSGATIELGYAYRLSRHHLNVALLFSCLVGVGGFFYETIV